MSVLFSLLYILLVFPEHLVGSRPVLVTGDTKMDPPWSCLQGAYGLGHDMDLSLQPYIHMMLGETHVPCMFLLDPPSSPVMTRYYCYP